MDNIKALQTERDNLMSVIDQKDAFIKNIKSWLVNEVNEILDVVDVTDDIILGRHECAESLLNQIEKWKNE